ncbi:hypothetical protein FIA58_005195 [Flavobacterium jejuense]|uniref:Lipoprotein n=1 Tax=Flavobacterium jejuense TaxID=1544455 RepID=A0ABX0IQJ3_9FLAO|nr:hypothetical protein [Flavobacterium jejuense]NHN25069.1 hypothetical protein [Flavobacterium jejuense]
MKKVFVFLLVSLISCKKEEKNISKPEIPEIKKEKSLVEKEIDDPFLFLSLKDTIDVKTLEFPFELERNAICVTISISYGWNAFDDRIHYIFSEDSIINAFKEKIPKSYLKGKRYKKKVEKIKLNNKKKSELLASLKAEKTINFQKYNQTDFTIDSNKISRCIVTDNNGYSITFLQNNTYNSFFYYAPIFALNKCDDETINKSVLKEFIELLKIWKVEL